MNEFSSLLIYHINCYCTRNYQNLCSHSQHASFIPYHHSYTVVQVGSEEWVPEIISFTRGLSLKQQSKAVFGKQHCANCQRLMLIRKYCWSSDMIIKSNSERCHTQKQLMHTTATRVYLQKQLTDAFKGLLLEASPAICYITALTLMPTVKHLNNHIESIPPIAMVHLYWR